MGESKRRKAAGFGPRPAKTKTLYIGARRYNGSGKPEIVLGKATINIKEALKNNKRSLLRHICTNKWMHNPPLNEIAAYLIQTDSYAMAPKIEDGAYLINFYENDPTRPGMFSCREIVGGKTDIIKRTLEDEVQEYYGNDDSYEINTYLKQIMRKYHE